MSRLSAEAREAAEGMRREAEEKARREAEEKAEQEAASGAAAADADRLQVQLMQRGHEANATGDFAAAREARHRYTVS